MFGMRAKLLAGAAAAAVGMTLFAAGAAQAGDGSVFPPNYTFGDGSKGWKLASHGGVINPDVLVAFNPQSPGDGTDGLLIALLNPADPQLISTSTGGSFNFLIGLLLPAVQDGDGSVIPLPDAPNPDGFTGFRRMASGHDISVGLQFGPGQVDANTWAGRDPPGGLPDGHFLTGGFQFDQRTDPWMFFNISVDGTPLTFSLDNGVPEPAEWGLMIAGFGGVGAVLRSRRRAAALAA
jgi:hypothetical protein